MIVLSRIGCKTRPSQLTLSGKGGLIDLFGKFRVA